MYRRIVKRPLDVFLAICGAIVLFVPMLVIAIAIKIDSKGPVVFRQTRSGYKQRPFTVLKFRTMCNNAYEMGGIATREDDYRITKVGAFLRRTSLDELPQFFNIIFGNMAIIGPRPILQWEFDEQNTNSEYIKRFDVLPGMFCSVDLDYRASADRELQFKMDVEYAESISFIGDCRIFLGIIKTVLKGSNVYKDETTENIAIKK